MAAHTGLHTLYCLAAQARPPTSSATLTGPDHPTCPGPIWVGDRPATRSSHTKAAQRADPPHILLTTPESLALLVSYEDAGRTFAGLQRVISTRIHALAESKRAIS